MEMKVVPGLNRRTIEHVKADYSKAFAKMSEITALAKKNERDLTADEVARFDSLDCEIRQLAAEKEAMEADKRASDGVLARLESGELQLPENLRGGSVGGSSLRSRDGKPLMMAAGPKQRLSKQVIAGHPIGELIRAAAIGVSNFTTDEVRAALTSDDNSKGGYSIPSSWLAGWIDRAIEAASVAPYCTRILMDTATVNITTIAERPTVATKAELARFVESSMSFGSSRLEAFTTGSVLTASVEMLEDSPNAAQQIEMAAIKGLVDWFNLKLLNGSGNAEPTGILQRDGIPGADSVGDLTWDAIADAVTALRKEIFIPNLCVVSPANYNALHLQRELTAGDGGYLPRPEHLKDLNIVASSHCPDSKVVIGDFTQMIIGIRQGARVEVSAEADDAFEKNAVKIRMKLRGDWVPAHNAGFYILDDVTVPE